MGSTHTEADLFHPNWAWHLFEWRQRWLWYSSCRLWRPPLERVVRPQEASLVPKGLYTSPSAALRLQSAIGASEYLSKEMRFGSLISIMESAQVQHTCKLRLILLIEILLANQIVNFITRGPPRK